MNQNEVKDFNICVVTCRVYLSIMQARMVDGKENKEQNFHEITI